MKKATGFGVLRFCAVVAVMGLSLASVPFSAQAAAAPAKPITLTLNYWATYEDPMGKTLLEYVAEIEKNTGGRVKITIHPGGTLTPPPQAYEGVVAGISDMAFVGYGFNPGRHPLMQAVTLFLPIKNETEATKIFNECVEKFKPKEFADTKLLWLTATAPGFPLLAKKPITTIEDFKGLKIRTLGIQQTYVRELGAVPVNLQVGDIYSGLDKGVIDGTMGNLLLLDSWKLADVIKYVLRWHWGPSHAWGLHMNLKVWNDLPPDIQRVFEAAREKYQAREIQNQDEAEKKGLEAGLAKGMKVLTPSPELTKQLTIRAKPMYDKYVADCEAKGLPGREFLEYILKRAEGR
jgi:TRAP-type transport system periplasmic protein